MLKLRARVTKLWPQPAHWTPGLSRFAASYAVGIAADAFVDVSLAGSLFFNISPDASREQVLLYLVINLIPFTFLAPLIGPAIDRFPRSHRFIATTIFLVRAGLVVCMALTLFELAFFFFTLAILIAAKGSGIIKQALVPSLVKNPEDLVSANSRLSRLSLITGSVAASAAVGVLAISSPYMTLAVGCAGFIGAAALATRLPDQPKTKPATGRTADAEFLQLHTPIVAATAWAFTMIRGAVGFFTFGVVFALRRDSEPFYVYGAVAAAWAIGTFAGNVAAPGLRRRASEDRLTAGSLIALAVVAAFGALGPSRLLLIVTAGVIGLGASIGRQGFDALVQSRTPITSRGAAFARFETRFQLGWVGGAIVAVAVATPTRISMAVIAVSTIPAAIFYLRNVRELRQVGADEPLNPIALARGRIEQLAALDPGAHARVTAIELGGVADLTRTAGVRVRRDLLDRIAKLRGTAVSGGEPDAAELEAAIIAMKSIVSAHAPPPAESRALDPSALDGSATPLQRKGLRKRLMRFS